jgi:hypothetical protein
MKAPVVAENPVRTRRRCGNRSKRGGREPGELWLGAMTGPGCKPGTCGGLKPHPSIPAVAELVDEGRTRGRWTRVPAGCVSQNGTRDTLSADPKRENRGSKGLGSRSGCPAGLGICSLSAAHWTADRQATSPEGYGSKRKSQIHSICDFDSSLECAGLVNPSSPGYEVRS